MLIGEINNNSNNQDNNNDDGTNERPQSSSEINLSNILYHVADYGVAIDKFDYAHTHIIY